MFLVVILMAYCSYAASTSMVIYVVVVPVLSPATRNLCVFFMIHRNKQAALVADGSDVMVL